MLYTKGVDSSVKNVRSLTDGIDHPCKKFAFWPIVSIHRLKIFFLLTTIDLINVFCHQIDYRYRSNQCFFDHWCPTLEVTLYRVLALEWAKRVKLDRSTLGDVPPAIYYLYYSPLFALWYYIEFINSYPLNTKSFWIFKILLKRGSACITRFWIPFFLLVRTFPGFSQNFIEKRQVAAWLLTAFKTVLCKS